MKWAYLILIVAIVIVGLVIMHRWQVEGAQSAANQRFIQNSYRPLN